MALYLQLCLLPFKKMQASCSGRTKSKFQLIHCSLPSPPTRRTTNYQPNQWNYNYIQSLPIDFLGEKYSYQRDILMIEVRCLIHQQSGLIEQLELVDTIFQLGLNYLFDSEIKDLLNCISSSMHDINNLIENNNLYGFALLFRLLREHGINSASILRVDALITCFKKVRENFNPTHQHSIKEMLSLYEASYLAVEGEEELDEAGKIAMEYLRHLPRSSLCQELVEEIDHALELPLRWRFLRLHTRWFIDAYGKKDNANHTLLALAKLDFNIVQSTYKIELKEMSRWKIDTAQQLPNSMKMCLAALFSTMNDIAYNFSMEKELDILPYIKRMWADICNVYLIEAEWYYNEYTPKLDDYLENAWVSISGPCTLTAIYCLSDDLTKEALESWNFYPPIIRYSSMLSRLYDDLATSTDEIQRGDNSKSIQCRMKETNNSEPDARDYIRRLIRRIWKKLNGELITSPTSIESFKECLLGMPKAAQFFYQNGDGYAMDDGKIKGQIIYMLIDPIPL